MNANEKSKMYNHYRGLGWTDGEISVYGKIDLKGKRPVKATTASKSSEKSTSTKK
jgi:hypothetical protein|tara:strand:- start:436 stop:600 length:165 start_codon:yes stop_codon:yes gene_type:complete